MDWILVSQLIVQLGIPAVQKLIALWESKAQVTSAEFNNLLSLANQTARDRMLLVLKSQGIDPASPQGQALLALIGQNAK